MSTLELIRRQPVPRLPRPLSPLAQREQENKLIERGAIEAFRKGLIDQDRLRGILAGLDVPAREIDATVIFEVARLAPSPRVAEREPPEVKKARELRTQAAITEFRQGKISEEVLRSRLEEAGHVRAVVEAFVDRELARVPIPEAEEIPTPAMEPPEERQARNIKTKTARELFKQGKITADELRSLLISIGNDPDVAAAITELEVIRREG